MQSFLYRFLITALSLAVAVAVLPGLAVDNVVTLLVAAFLLGIVNAIVRPILIILTLPITIATLGIFLLLINVAMFALVGALLPGFYIAGFGSALMGWLIVTITGWFASRLFEDDRPRGPRRRLLR